MTTNDHSWPPVSQISYLSTKAGHEWPHEYFFKDKMEIASQKWAWYSIRYTVNQIGNVNYFSRNKFYFLNNLEINFDLFSFLYTA